MKIPAGVPLAGRPSRGEFAAEAEPVPVAHLDIRPGHPPWLPEVDETSTVPLPRRPASRSSRRFLEGRCDGHPTAADAARGVRRARGDAGLASTRPPACEAAAPTTM